MRNVGAHFEGGGGQHLQWFFCPNLNQMISSDDQESESDQGSEDEEDASDDPSRDRRETFS